MTEAAIVQISEEQRIIVRERLRLLTIAAYIRGGMTAVFSCFFLIYVLMFSFFAAMPDSAWTNKNPGQHRSSVIPSNIVASPSPSPTPQVVNQGPPKMMFRIMAAFFGGFTLLGWAIGGLTAYAGWCIQRRQRRLLVLIVASFNCIFIPYGTLFGVATILVLSSPAAQAEFNVLGAPAV